MPAPVNISTLNESHFQVLLDIHYVHNVDRSRFRLDHSAAFGRPARIMRIRCGSSEDYEVAVRTIGEDYLPARVSGSAGGQCNAAR